MMDMITAKRQEQRAPSPQQRLAPSSSQTAPVSPEYRPTGPPNALLLSSISVTTATWLIIGGVAFSSKAVADSNGAAMVVSICCFLYLFAATMTLFGLQLQYKSSVGPAWVSGLLGLGIGGFCAISASAVMGYSVLFWTLGGMQAGWLIEWTLHPVGRFLSCLKQGTSGMPVCPRVPAE